MIADYILSTDRLGLRRWIAADEEVFIGMNQDPQVMEFFPKLLSPEDSLAMIGRIDACLDANGYGLFAVEHRATREFLGFTGFSHPSFESSFTPCVEIGWRLKQSAWGQGYATEAAKACLQYGFEVVGVGAIYSFTSLTNLRSQNVMQKIGMRRIGEFEHPRLEPESVLCRHVLYRIEKTEQI